MDGGGLFAESNFQGIGGNAPRTIAAWVRHRGGEEKFSDRGSQYPLDDPYPGYGASTPFGAQSYLLDYGGLGLTTAEGVIGALAADTEYEFVFHVAARPGVPSATYRAELVAFDQRQDDQSRKTVAVDRPGKVLAHVSGMAEASDMSEQAKIAYVAKAGSPHLGKDLAIRLVHEGKLVRSGGKVRHSGRVLYDHLRLTARSEGGDTQLIFEEGFELPRVVGFSRQVSMSPRWVRGGGLYHQGIFNHHPPYSTPYYSWGNHAPGQMWAGFVYDTSHPSWGTTTGRFWIGAEDEKGIPENTWVHVATVYTGQITDEGGVEILHYLNGQLLESFPVAPPAHQILDLVETATTETDAESASPLRFGAAPDARSGSPTLNGDIDEFFLFRGALSSEEIEWLMETHSPRFLRK